MPVYKDEDGYAKDVNWACNKWVDNGDGSKTQFYKGAMTTTIGDINHPCHSNMTKEIQKTNEISSPLFYWLIQQKHYSVSMEELFSKANEIYKDPFVAMGIITWMFHIDAHAGYRWRVSVTSSRVQPLFYTKDLSGNNYHFWGYGIKAFYSLKEYF